MRQTFYEFCMLHERTNLLKEWDESRNFPLTPDTVSYGSKKKVWWTCENGHSWQTTVHVRSEGSGCPYCTGRKVLPGFNDLETLYPDVAAQWDREKNGSLSPRDVSTGSKIRIWWRCPVGHSWQSPVASRTAWGHGCPVCAGKTIVTGENDLAHLQPEIAAQWDKRKNGRLKPSDVAVSSNRPAWWRCELGHSYRATVASRTQRKTGCPYCAGRKVLKGFNDLKTLRHCFTVASVAQRRADAGNGHARQQQKGLVAVLHGTRVEIGHLSAHRRAAMRLPRLRRKNQAQNQVNPARGDGQRIKKT